MFAVACGGEEGTETTTTAGGTETTAAPSGEPIKFGFDEGFTSFMAYDCELADKGIKTALAMLDNQCDGPAARVLSQRTTAPTRSSRSTRPGNWWRATGSTS